EVRSHGLLTETLDAPALVRDVEEDEPDARVGGSVGDRRSDGCAEVVELGDSAVARRPHLPVCIRVQPTRELGCLAARLLEHALAPGPEIASCGATAERPLERVAVGVDDPRQPQRPLHEPRRYTNRLRP